MLPSPTVCLTFTDGTTFTADLFESFWSPRRALPSRSQSMQQFGVGETIQPGYPEGKVFRIAVKDVLPDKSAARR